MLEHDGAMKTEQADGAVGTFEAEIALLCT